MRRTAFLAITLAAIGLALSACSSREVGPTAPTGSLGAQPGLLPAPEPGSASDPVGDVANYPFSELKPDLVWSRVYCDETDSVRFEVRFEPSTFVADSMVATFVLDLDRDPSTGFPGIDAANSDSALFGLDAQLRVNEDLAGMVKVQIYTGSFPFITAGTYPVEVLADGFRGAVPVSLLGDDGALNYKVLGTGRFPLPGNFTGILDYLPDRGLAPVSAPGCLVTTLPVVVAGAEGAGINCRNGNGMIQLTLQGSETFDVDDVDLATLELAGGGEWHTDRRTGEPRRHQSDMNSDGYDDLRVHVRLRDTTLDCGSLEAMLTGMLVDGTPFAVPVPVNLNNPGIDAIGD